MRAGPAQASHRLSPGEIELEGKNDKLKAARTTKSTTSTEGKPKEKERDDRRQNEEKASGGGSTDAESKASALSCEKTDPQKSEQTQKAAN